MRKSIRHRLSWTLVITLPIALLATIVAHGEVLIQERPAAAAVVTGVRPYPQYRNPVKSATTFRVGVYKPTLSPSLLSVNEFDKRTAHKVGLILTYSEWQTDFRLGVARAAWKNGQELIVQMEPKGVSLRAIVNGKYDRYLKTFADQVRWFGRPVVLGFAHEMNGGWYSWGKGRVATTIWVRAWRHVVRVFRGQHATNASWIWTIHHASGGLKQYWPGARFVDMVGVDGYFEKPGGTYAKIFGGPVRAIRKLTAKPILISETAVGPRTGHMARDIRQLFAGARRQHLAGIVWFDVHQFQPPYHQDWELEDHPRALAAFRAALQFTSTTERRNQMTRRTILAVASALAYKEWRWINDGGEAGHRDP